MMLCGKQAMLRKHGAGGGTRTRTELALQRILRAAYSLSLLC
jgi:hypothetical protein